MGNSGTLLLISLGCVVFQQNWRQALALTNFSATQEKSIEQLRARLDPAKYQDYMLKDEYLIRWLIEGSYDASRAFIMLQASMKFRRDNNIDNLLEEKFPEFSKTCSYHLDARDKIGRPVILHHFGDCPVRRLFLFGLIQKHQRYTFQQYEKVVQAISNAGKGIYNTIVIVDASGFTWRDNGCFQCIPVLAKLRKEIEDNYPAIYHRLIHINAPASFQSVENLLGPTTSKHTRNATRVYGFDKAEWQSEISKMISLDQLPKQYGGTL